MSNGLTFDILNGISQIFRVLPNDYRGLVAVKLKMINQDRRIFGDFSVNF